MRTSPDIRPLPRLPHKPPSHLLRLPNSPIILSLPTTNSTAYSIKTQNYIASCIRLKSSQTHIEPSTTSESDKSSICLNNSISHYRTDYKDASYHWINTDNGPRIAIRPFLLAKPSADPICAIINLYDH
jgi:hypothetical protein